MKAAVREQYGPPAVLRIQEIEKPKPGKGEVLVQVYAATVNRTDCGILLGKPFIIKFFTGLPRPKKRTTGTDFAGRIEAVGEGVTNFKVGNRVWGFDDNGLQSHTEYLVFNASKGMLTIPEGISYEAAAAAAEGAHYAYNFITRVNLQTGQPVLVNGATGAIGSAMVQLLKYFGARVTAVCATEHLERVRSLGADEVIDYTQEDFTKRKERFDYVFDAVGKSTFGKCKHLLQPGGIYISSELGPGAQNAFFGLLSPFFRDKKVLFPIPLNIDRSLKFLRERLEDGSFKPVLDRTYPLEEIKTAFEYVLSGQKVGNVVLRITPH